MQTNAAVINVNRIDPIVSVTGQIIRRHDTAASFRMRRHFLREFATIKGFAFAGGNLLKRIGLSGQGPIFACVRRATVDGEIAHEIGLRVEHFGLPRPAFRGNR